MKHSIIRPLLAGLGIAVAAFSVSAQQAAPGQGPGPGGMMAPGSGPMTQGAGPQGAGPRGGMGPRAGAPAQKVGEFPQAVLDQLALTPDQKGLLDAAQKARDDMRATRLTSRAEHQKAMEALYATDPVDPRALMALAKIPFISSILTALNLIPATEAKVSAGAATLQSVDTNVADIATKVNEIHQATVKAPADILKP